MEVRQAFPDTDSIRIEIDMTCIAENLTQSELRALLSGPWIKGHRRRLDDGRMRRLDAVVLLSLVLSATVWGVSGAAAAAPHEAASRLAEEVRIVDLASRKVVRQLPRLGIVSQLGWSPDGKWFTGTASHLGPFWNIARMNAETGEISAVSETDRYNCTPDWVADSRRVVYARGIIPEKPGRAELWVATLDGRQPQPLYAEEGHHIYGACASPDMKYLLFTRSVADLTKVDQKDTTLAIVRWADTPMRGDDGESLRQRFPQARTGPRLDLGPGWEPFWTLVDLAQAASTSAAAPSNTGQSRL